VDGGQSWYEHVLSAHYPRDRFCGNYAGTVSGLGRNRRIGADPAHETVLTKENQTNM
jgi:hypothetical protein